MTRDVHVDCEVAACAPTETEFAILLVNSSIPEWNVRWSRSSSPDELFAPGRAGGISFIFDYRYEVAFRHDETDRIYGIVAPRYEVYRGSTCQRVPLDPRLVERVERLDFERLNDRETDG